MGVGGGESSIARNDADADADDAVDAGGDGDAGAHTHTHTHTHTLEGNDANMSFDVGLQRGMQGSRWTSAKVSAPQRCHNHVGR
jgi:hypothetical protein